MVEGIIGMKPGLTVFDCEQGSEDWIRARMNIPTASMFHTVMASGRGGGESKTRRKYMLQLAGEILTNIPMESYSNSYMERGKIMEDELRNKYALRRGKSELKRIGFIHDPALSCGCSPDSMVIENGKTGGLEIKSQAPHILIETILKGEPPPEFKAQLQGTLMITGWPWIDLMIGYSGMRYFEQRIFPDIAYIRTIESEVRQFNKELAAVVAQMQ